LFRLFRVMLVVSLLPFALAAVYTWWIAARRKGMSDAELVHTVVHTQPGRTLYSLCNLVLYGWIVPATIAQTFYRHIKRKFSRVTTYKLGPLPAEEFDDLMRTIGEHYKRQYDESGIFV
jgi:hypothetical protein